MTLTNASEGTLLNDELQAHLYICDSTGTCVRGSPVRELEGQRLTESAGHIWRMHGLPADLAPQLEGCIKQVLRTGEIVRLLIKDMSDSCPQTTYACQFMPTTLEGNARGIAVRLQQLPNRTDGPEESVNQQMLDVVPTPVVVVRLSDWKCLYANAAAATLFGRPTRDLVGYHLGAVFDQPSDPQRILEHLIIDRQLSDFGSYVRDENDQRHHVTISGGCAFSKGNQAGMLFVTPAPERSAQPAPTERDALTGLPNRNALADHLEGAIRRAAPEGELVGALFIDLNRFKAINDEHGHRVGDELLAVVARRIAGCVRHYETMARFGGDEFVVILERLQDEQETLRVKEDIQRVVAKPVGVGELSLSVTASIGVAYYPRDAANVEDLIHAADRAMYNEKASRRAHH